MNCGRARTGCSGACLASVLLVPAMRGLAAQRREPLFRQVKLPHGYYWREMYVPQPTSGPSSVAWSPDDRDVVYAMQGTLWRQRIGSGEASQLTDGPGYDAQPDVSPDGKYVAYVSYDGARVDLLLLDLATGERDTLVNDGSVNLEPRWSPDGTRIVFVSSSFAGRWHVFVADLHRASAPRLNAVSRVTEDRDSGLPRYYYSIYDHYLSPTWSPDGR